MSELSPFSGAKRKSDFRGDRSESNSERTSATNKHFRSTEPRCLPRVERGWLQYCQSGPRGGHAATRIHQGSRCDCGIVAVRSTSATALVAGSRVSQWPLASRVCDRGRRLPKGIVRGRLCRATECHDRVPLGRRAVRSLTRTSTRIGSPAGRRHCGSGRVGTCCKSGNDDYTHCLWKRGRSRSNRVGCQP